MVAKIEHRTRTGCPVACALDIIGDHWTLLVIRNLMFLGLHEYKDMLAKEEQISSSILTDRLKKLEHEGLVSSIPHPGSGRRKLYYLTESGKDLLNMMVELTCWANRNISDSLRIPPEKQKLIENDPEKFKQLVRAEIAKWEQSFLKE
ncbi:MAG: winged helix-turn-helix transcriptional regulator [Neptuniibacter sp.]